jgi:hypothetical protein
MGFFSWKTSDTQKTIWNKYSGKCKPVYLLMPDGNHIYEPAYEGYGVFGGIDVFVLLAEKNGLTGDFETLRSAGIKLMHENISPLSFEIKFSFKKNAVYQDLKQAKHCPTQGYFGE